MPQLDRTAPEGYIMLSNAAERKGCNPQAVRTAIVTGALTGYQVAEGGCYYVRDDAEFRAWTPATRRGARGR